LIREELQASSIFSKTIKFLGFKKNVKILVVYGLIEGTAPA
jgi:hypothetical protein